MSIRSNANCRKILITLAAMRPGSSLAAQRPSSNKKFRAAVVKQVFEVPIVPSHDGSQAKP